MARKEILAPFIPKIKNEGDLENFDKTFTDEKIQDSLTSAYVNSHQFQRFDGFTYEQSPKLETITEVIK
jgi:Protein kinase C terminal domain